MNELIIKIVNNGNPDSVGNTIVYDSEQQGLLLSSPSGTFTPIGSLVEENNQIHLIIKDSERNFHYKTRSWGVNLQAFTHVDVVKLKTEVAEYTVDRNQVLNYAMIFDYCDPTFALKTYIPEYLWRKTYLDPLIGPLINQMGFEWFQLLKGEFTKNYMQSLSAFVKKDRSKHEVFPQADDVFRAFKLTPPSMLKVVLIGEEPYPMKCSDGLAYSSGVEHIIPTALLNMFKEIETDIYEGYLLNFVPDLSRLALQGVLLLNSVLTTSSNGRDSHSNKGWELFTTEAINKIASLSKNVVYILMGDKAQSYRQLINPNENLILETCNPSDACKHGSKFFGSSIFSKTNKYLEETLGKQYKIIW